MHRAKESISMRAGDSLESGWGSTRTSSGRARALRWSYSGLGAKSDCYAADDELCL